jgi:hypothetical protein
MKAEAEAVFYWCLSLFNVKKNFEIFNFASTQDKGTGSSPITQNSIGNLPLVPN